jgi:hypothetical protein
MVFLMMLVLKGLSYSLNNPCKEILYQPTSQNIKFKAKSWIDVFGARGSKALGTTPKEDAARRARHKPPPDPRRLRRHQRVLRLGGGPALLRLFRVHG